MHDKSDKTEGTKGVREDTQSDTYRCPGHVVIEIGGIPTLSVAIGHEGWLDGPAQQPLTTRRPERDQGGRIRLIIIIRIISISEVSDDDDAPQLGSPSS